MNEQPGSVSVVQSVSTPLNAIGYSGIGYKTAEFVMFMLSKQGQEIVEKDGYIPVPKKVTAKDLAKLGL